MRISPIVNANYYNKRNFNRVSFKSKNPAPPPCQTGENVAIILGGKIYGGKTTFDAVRDYLADRFVVDPNDIAPDDNLRTTFFADSLDRQEFLIDLETAADRQMSEKETTDLQKVSDVVSFIETNVLNKGTSNN